MNLDKLRGKKVYVGLSGGVDSGVTAALLQQAGAQVTGVFIKGWYPPGMPCTWAADRRDAMRVAAHLRIPFLTFDASAEYKKGVIDYLLGEYRAGHTPNPDIMCNREVKFGAFYRFAREQGADYIATGHYAQTEHRKERTALLRGSDTEKDQSYFLWAVPQEALAMTLFPLGALTKAQTRAKAHAFALPVAQKRDSQGICFLGSISVEEFLRQEFGTTPGTAHDRAGATVGTHDGALLHTLGARVALEGAPAGPWYVVGKDIEKNMLTVSHERASTAQSDTLTLSQTNFFRRPAAGEVLDAQYRYHGPRIAGRLSDDGSRFTASTSLPEAIAAGQSLVLYCADECIGGGIIG